MRKLKIYQNNASVIELIDDSDEDLDLYCQELSKIFHMTNISILKTSKNIFIGRPSQLNSIVIEEIVNNDNPDIKMEVATEAKLKDETSKSEVKEDIIMDMD